MTDYTPIPIGSLGWGAPVNTAFTTHADDITEMQRQGTETLAALGFLAMNYDPALGAAGTTVAAGVVNMIRFDLMRAATLSTVTVGVTTAGTTLTAGQNFAGIYDSAGTLVAVSADQTVAWGTTGEKNIAMAVPYAAAAGAYYAALLSNGTTPPNFLRSATGAAGVIINHGQSMATARFTTVLAGQTVLPASITMASRTLSTAAFFVGVS